MSQILNAWSLSLGIIPCDNGYEGYVWVEMVMNVKILVVEDDKSSAELMRMMLKSVSSDVMIAMDAYIALEAIEQAIPDIILLDLRLPNNFDGWQLIERLRAHPTTQDVPIIVVSASYTPEDMRRAYKAGCNEYLNKPVNVAQLLSVVRRYVENAPANRTS